ncbi:hypothetical protein [Vibrio sp. NH-UV-68]|uniref:hypothetical protein n=1 Tax=unclassified Vibrio TaxID=2614977 RepID=UPI0036F2DC17
MIHFWNGNKSAARQAYEHQLLELVLHHIGIDEQVHNDMTDYPNADDEGAVLDNGADLLVTVAGNRKFMGRDFIEVPTPLCKGLLGWRVPIIHHSRQGEFAHMSEDELKQQCVGVPNTWVDAELFRHNGYNVKEKGSLAEMLTWLAQGKVDFLTLGANEADEVLQQYDTHTASLMIEPTKALRYSFPVVFYVNSSQPQLAMQLEQGLKIIINNGCFDQLFIQHFAKVLKAVDMESRDSIALENPLLPMIYR